MEITQQAHSNNSRLVLVLEPYLPRIHAIYKKYNLPYHDKYLHITNNGSMSHILQIGLDRIIHAS